MVALLVRKSNWRTGFEARSQRACLEMEPPVTVSYKCKFAVLSLEIRRLTYILQLCTASTGARIQWSSELPPRTSS
jgi:hypothetical protein